MKRRQREVVCLLVLAGCLDPGPSAAPDPTFLLNTEDPGYANPAFLGNGLFSTVTSPLGVRRSHSFMAWVYDEAEGDVPRLTLLPAWNEIDVRAGGRWLSTADPGSLRAYHQIVHLYDGYVETSYEWGEGSSAAEVRTRRFVSRAHPHVAVVRIALTPRSSDRITVRFPLSGWPPPSRLPLAVRTEVEPEWGPEELWYPGHMIVRAAGVEGEGPSMRVWLEAQAEGRPTRVAEAAALSRPEGLAGLSVDSVVSATSAALDLSFDAAAGTTYTFDKVVAVVSSVDADRPLERARELAGAAHDRGYDALFNDHTRAWHALWETDVRIEGDTALQRVVRSMLFYLLSSVREGTDFSIPPMGLSSGGYYGHVFWDADTWMFPPLLLLHPEAARSIVMFRSRTLEAAQRNAAKNGYRGAMYPWEADDIGNETTPRFAYQNALYEIHINGDVAIAQWQYYLATGDSSWLARHGYPVIRATAEFWTSRTTYDEARGRYEIRNLVSVAEDQIGVHNEGYTNAVAKKNLEIAVAAARRLGVDPDPRWAEIARKIFIPYDSAGEYHPTYEGAPPEERGSVVTLLAYPLGIAMSDVAKRNDLEAALRRFRERGGGAMMTTTLYPVVAAELGDSALVDSLVPETHRPWLRPPYNALSETPHRDAVHFVTGGGGFLQQVLFGYTGLRLEDDGWVETYDPILPSSIERLEIRNVRLNGTRYDVVVESGDLTLVERRR